MDKESGLPTERSETSQWPTSSPPSQENLDLALRLCSDLAPSSETLVVNAHNRNGWSAQDCIKLDCLDKSYIVKVPRRPGIDTVTACNAERTRACWAAINGLGPDVLKQDAVSGAFAMQFIKGQTLATPELTWQYMPQLMQLLHRFHSFPVKYVSPWMAHWDPLAVVQRELDVAKQSKCMAEEDIQLVEELISWVRRGIGNVSHLHVPCHNDFHGLNIVLDEGGKLWAIDYEECDLGDPMWDLAYLTATLEIDRYALVERYGCKPEEEDRLGYYHFLAMGYYGTWRATHGPSFANLHRDCMIRLRNTLKSDRIDLQA